MSPDGSLARAVAILGRDRLLLAGAGLGRGPLRRLLEDLLLSRRRGPLHYRPATEAAPLLASGTTTGWRVSAPLSRYAVGQSRLLRRGAQRVLPGPCEPGIA